MSRRWAEARPHVTWRSLLSPGRHERWGWELSWERRGTKALGHREGGRARVKARKPGQRRCPPCQAPGRPQLGRRVEGPGVPAGKPRGRSVAPREHTPGVRSPHAASRCPETEPQTDSRSKCEQSSKDAEDARKIQLVSYCQDDEQKPREPWRTVAR